MSNEKKQTEKICIGCGRSSFNPIDKQYSACCPDNNYVIISNETKQTAVDILCEKLAMKLGIPLTFYIDHQEEIKEAKEMHKEEIIDAFDEGNPNGFINKTGEQYYNETYGGNK